MLLVALVVAGREVYFETTILETGDAAVNALQIDNAKGASEIYGNYSRFEFNHPGPAFFYIYAAGEYVFLDWLGVVPTPHNAHLLASLVVQVACFALALALIDLWIGSGAFLALALLGGLWHFSLAEGSFYSVWPPHVLLIAGGGQEGHSQNAHLARRVWRGPIRFHQDAHSDSVHCARSPRERFEKNAAVADSSFV